MINPSAPDYARLARRPLGSGMVSTPLPVRGRRTVGERTGGGLLIVVAAAIVRDGRVLAARRTGRVQGWEFPGGKVEPGEQPAAALRREIAEELGVGVEVIGPLGESRSRSILLRLYLARLTGPEPVASTDHDRLRWLAAGELGAVDWLALDRPLLPDVAALLDGPALHS